jgi:heme ABC exporter ATP-binding subunit CcmA
MLVIARDLTKAYDNQAVFSNLSFEVGPGEIVVVAGRNGSGKSTLLRLLAGLIQPTGGRVEAVLDGRPLERQQWQKVVGYLAPEASPYLELTPLENLEVMARIRGAGDARMLAQSLLDRVALEVDRQAPAATLSTGQRQRLKLALALLGPPRILLLDEPTSNLDADGRKLVANLIEDSRKQGPVVIATNDPEDLKLGERRLDLDDLGR